MIHWRTLEAGKKEASARKTPILVDFYYGEGCHRCVALEERVYADADIAQIVKRDFVPVRIDISHSLSGDEKKLAELMKTGGECMLLFLDAAGQVVANRKGQRICTMGMLSPEDFKKYLDDARKNISH